jgi:phosphate acetyltransferase
MTRHDAGDTMNELSTNAHRHAKYERLLDWASSLTAVPTAVAHPCDESSLAGAVDAAAKNLIVPILVGPAKRVSAIAAKAGIDISRWLRATRACAPRDASAIASSWMCLRMPTC